MTLDELTINFSNVNKKQLLLDWQWLVENNKIPVLISAMGDMFLQDKMDGTVHYLNFVDGVINKIAESGDEFRALLSNKDFVVDHFPVQVIGELRDSGNILKPNNVYSFKVPPRLGGEFSLDNIEQCDCVVNSSITAQIHEQLRNVPDGAKINNIQIKIKKRPKWKFWS